mgnify:CR=1 FL=1
MTRTQVRLREFSEQFWFIPGLMSIAGLLLAEIGIRAERDWAIPTSLRFVYSGGEEGSRTLLAAIAGTTIGVAGTVFSITIAALSYSAGSMGPRLLKNFTRDRGNQVVLGIFIGSFTFSLFSLRAVRGEGEGGPAFAPHYNVSFALLLSLACIGALVYYLGHVTSTINPTYVVNFLRNDMRNTLLRATRDRDVGRGAISAPGDDYWAQGEPLYFRGRSGYLQATDTAKLRKLATADGVVVKVTVRPGDYVYPNAVVAIGVPSVRADYESVFTIGDQRIIDQDLEYAVRQLSEVAVRALSPAVNDPVTAMDVLDRFGDALCALEDRVWPDGVFADGGEVRLVVPVTSFAGLTDSMFHMIRQYGHSSPAVALKMFEVLTVSASCLTSDTRLEELERHAALLIEDIRRGEYNPGDLADLEHRYEVFCRTAEAEHQGHWRVPERG